MENKEQGPKTNSRKTINGKMLVFGKTQLPRNIITI